MDIIDVEILEDGVISVKTESFKEANHVNADELLDEITEAMGGESIVRKREHPFMKNKRVLRGGKVVKLGR